MSKIKVVLITGVSSGIGNATARALAQAGYRVFGGARAPAKVTKIPGVHFVRLDVRDEVSISEAVAEVIAMAGSIDILINNAGVSLIGPIEATSVAEAQALFDTNVFGVLRMVREILPDMRRRRSGLIINVSSVLGFLPAPFMGLYASSKHAVEGLSETLDHEVRGLGIRVVLFEPNFTKSSFDTSAASTSIEIGDYATALDHSRHALRKQFKKAADAAAIAARLVAIIGGPHRMRQPGNGSAKVLSILRRFAPASMVDKSLRTTFGLDATR